MGYFRNKTQLSHHDRLVEVGRVFWRASDPMPLHRHSCKYRVQKKRNYSGEKGKIMELLETSNKEIKI